MTATKRLSTPDNNGLKITNVADGTTATDVSSKGQVDAAQAYAIARGNHTGTQLASTVSNFDAQVRSSRLDQMTAPTGPVSWNSQLISALLDPVSAQDAATKAYVDAQLSAQATGLILKGTVRAAAATNVSVTSAPATIDGITPSNGDVFLLMGNTTASENGPRVWTAAGSAMARAANWNTSARATLGSFWDIREGSSADTFALLTNDAAVTLDTTALTFVIRGASVTSSGYTTTCPSVSAGSGWTVTHGLNSKFLVVQVAATASPYDYQDVRIERTSANTVTVQPDVALASGAYDIMIQRVV